MAPIRSIAGSRSTASGTALGRTVISAVGGSTGMENGIIRMPAELCFKIPGRRMGFMLAGMGRGSSKKFGYYVNEYRSNGARFGDICGKT